MQLFALKGRGVLDCRNLQDHRWFPARRAAELVAHEYSYGLEQLSGWICAVVQSAQDPSEVCWQQNTSSGTQHQGISLHSEEQAL